MDNYQKILFLDKKKSDNKLITEAFYDFNCEINSVENIEEYTKAITENSYDLLIIEPTNEDLNHPQNWKIIIEQAEKALTPILSICSENGDKKVAQEYTKSDIRIIIKPSEKINILLQVLNLKQLIKSREILRSTNDYLDFKVAERTQELQTVNNSYEVANKELQNISVLRANFLSLISTEAKIHLQNISDSLSLLDSYSFQPEILSYFRMLNSSVNRLSGFANIALECSKLRLYKSKILNLSKINIEDIINQAINKAELKYENKTINPNINIKINTPLIIADEYYITKCINSIIDNAFKYSSDYGIIKIELTDIEDHNIKISIRDNGVGFSKIALNQLFMPLNNLGSQSNQNYGMSLHQAKLIIEAHSGNISIKSASNGALVTIELPKQIKN